MSEIFNLFDFYSIIFKCDVCLSFTVYDCAQRRLNFRDFVLIQATFHRRSVFASVLKWISLRWTSFSNHLLLIFVKKKLFWRIGIERLMSALLCSHQRNTRSNNRRLRSTIIFTAHYFVFSSVAVLTPRYKGLWGRNGTPSHCEYLRHGKKCQSFLNIWFWNAPRV